MLFSALVFVATYFLMLVAVRAYLGRRLTFLPVFSLGVVWFSFVGVSNALWAFQLAWYFVLLFLFATIYFLCIRPRYRPVALTLAILAAILGSLSMVQGFLIWPVGARRAPLGVDARAPAVGRSRRVARRRRDHDARVRPRIHVGRRLHRPGAELLGHAQREPSRSPRLVLLHARRATSSASRCAGTPRGSN